MTHNDAVTESAITRRCTGVAAGGFSVFRASTGRNPVNAVVRHHTSRMGLNHDFVLLDRASDGEWELTRFIHDPRAIHLHDDLVRYMLDSLKWIPSHNPSARAACHGLNMWGPTLIEHDGAIIAERVFRGWAELFANGPIMLDLTGGYSWIDGKPEGTGQYERLQYSRDDTVRVLLTLADYSAQIQLANGRLYLYHCGV